MSSRDHRSSQRSRGRGSAHTCPRKRPGRPRFGVHRALEGDGVRKDFAKAEPMGRHPNRVKRGCPCCVVKPNDADLPQAPHGPRIRPIRSMPSSAQHSTPATRRRLCFRSPGVAAAMMAQLGLRDVRRPAGVRPSGAGRRLTRAPSSQLQLSAPSADTGDGAGSAHANLRDKWRCSEIRLAISIPRIQSPLRATGIRAAGFTSRRLTKATWAAGARIGIVRRCAEPCCTATSKSGLTVDGVVARHSTDAFLGRGRFDLLIEPFTSSALTS